MRSALAQSLLPRRTRYYAIQMQTPHGTWQATQWIERSKRGNPSHAWTQFYRATMAHRDYSYRLVTVWADGHVEVLKESCASETHAEWINAVLHERGEW